MEALKAWFRKYGIYEYIDSVSPTKPPAIVYIDDRAIRFDGNADGLLEQIKSFRPWWEGIQESKMTLDEAIQHALEIAADSCGDCG